jgi:GNAT superfamily N-acetyltransferase
MNLTFTEATVEDAPALAALGTAAAANLTQQFGHGVWSAASTERGLRSNMRYARFIVARHNGVIAGSLRLAAKKPWAIDVTHFTPVKKALYMTHMAVAPEMQRQGVGRQLIQRAVVCARNWPADAIRLDAFDAEAGAGGFYSRAGFRETGRVEYRETPLVYFEMILSQPGLERSRT